jgi:glucose-1-phosphate thymidylyltransferase
MISCPEEIAYRMGFISRDMLMEIANSYQNNGYGEYLMQLAEREE